MAFSSKSVLRIIGWFGVSASTCQNLPHIESSDSFPNNAWNYTGWFSAALPLEGFLMMVFVRFLYALQLGSIFGCLCNWIGSAPRAPYTINRCNVSTFIGFSPFSEDVELHSRFFFAHRIDILLNGCILYCHSCWKVVVGIFPFSGVVRSAILVWHIDSSLSSCLPSVVCLLTWVGVLKLI